jgi:hypothetical protein
MPWRKLFTSNGSRQKHRAGRVIQHEASDIANGFGTDGYVARRNWRTHCRFCNYLAETVMISTQNPSGNGIIIYMSVGGGIFRNPGCSGLAAPMLLQSVTLRKG